MTNAANAGMLYRLSQAQLANALHPHYGYFYSLLSSDEQQQTSFERVVQGAYARLQHVHGSSFIVYRYESGQLLSFDTGAIRASLLGCVESIGTVVADVVGIFFGLVGINEEETRVATRAMLRELGQDTLRGLRATIHNIAAAEGAVNKAREIFGLLMQIKNAIGLSDIIGALRHSMHWWDWLICGICAVAQILIWFATDGVAFVAELALEGAAIATMVVDANKISGACMGVGGDGYPTITVQPQDREVNGFGSPFSLRAEATDNPAPTIQWQSKLDDHYSHTYHDIPGATSSTYSSSYYSDRLFRAVFTSQGHTTYTREARVYQDPGSSHPDDGGPGHSGHPDD